MSFLFALMAGVAMGALIQRAGASSPGMIARNLRLENRSVIKFMALTIAVGSVTTYTLAQFIPMHFDIKPLYLVGVLGVCRMKQKSACYCSFGRYYAPMCSAFLHVHAQK